LRRPNRRAASASPVVGKAVCAEGKTFASVRGASVAGPSSSTGFRSGASSARIAAYWSLPSFRWERFARRRALTLSSGGAMTDRRRSVGNYSRAEKGVWDASVPHQSLQHDPRHDPVARRSVDELGVGRGEVKADPAAYRAIRGACCRRSGGGGRHPRTVAQGKRQNPARIRIVAGPARGGRGPVRPYRAGAAQGAPARSPK
jgi:hypothetical protein